MPTLTIGTAVLAVIIGVLASVVAGAAGGVAVGGKAIGNELAATMGGFYGPLAGAAGILLGLAVLALIG